MIESDIIYIREMSGMLGISEAAVRGYIQRKSDAIPKWGKLGRKIMWTRPTYNKWLNSRK